METQKPVRRTDTYDDVGQAITELHGTLTQLWEAVTTVEAVDAARMPEPEQHANAMMQLTSACEEWQGTMVKVRDTFMAWMMVVSQEQQEAMSGQALLKDLENEDKG